MDHLNGFELYKKMQNIDNNRIACFITAFEDYRRVQGIISRTI